MIKEWFYMCSESVDVEQIKEAIDSKWDVEIWKDAGVLELTYDNESIDFELISINRWDDFSKSFVEKNGFVKVFAVTLGKEAGLESQKLFSEICQKNGGIFCADTEDFEPIIK